MDYQPASENDRILLTDAFNRLNPDPSILPLNPETGGALLTPGFPFPDPSLPGKKAAVFCREGGEVVGLAAGNAVPGSPTGYVTALLGPEPAVLRELLGSLTESLKRIDPALRKLRWVFYNHALFRWRLSGGWEHPGMPGVPADSPLSAFLAGEGWREFARMNAYGRSLAGYEIPGALSSRIAALRKEGLFAGLWDPALHGSFAPLAEALGSEDWRRQLEHNEAAAAPLPVVCAADMSREILAENGGRGFVCGFAGPLRVERCGRGWFAGIGIHPDYRRRGLGSVLFASLCRELAEMGAAYMTLFTGAEGAARRIYEAAGFRAFRTFSGMEKPV